MSKKNDSKNNSTIGYSGSVNVKVLNGTKIVSSTTKHNEGTQWFFQVLASSVIGNNERNNMPRYLDAFQRTGEEGSYIYTSILSTKVALTSKSFRSYNEDDVYGVMASMTAIVPHKSILFESDSSKTIDQLRIYSNDSSDDTLLAKVDLGDKAIEILSDSKNNIAIEWNMLFKNVS